VPAETQRLVRGDVGSIGTRRGPADPLPYAPRVRVAVVGPAVAAAVLAGRGVDAASRGGTEPTRCFVADAQGQLPVCTRAADGRWVVSTGAVAGNVGSHTFGVVVVLALVAAGVGIVVTVVRAVVARRDAARAARSPRSADVAHGVDDAAADLRLSAMNADGRRRASPASGGPHIPAPVAPGAVSTPSGPAAARLVELQGLRDAGLVTEDEYRARRTAIIDSV
jgi:hypothetical protein